MTSNQREHNPDVNSYNPSSPSGEGPGSASNENNGSNDIERGKDKDVIPVPPDSTPAAPVEEPPGSEGVPVGDVDDSPKQIARTALDKKVYCNYPCYSYGG